MATTRRRFLQGSMTAAAGTLAAPLVPNLPSVATAATRLDPKLVQLDSGIEPLVRLIETTSRGDLLEQIGKKVQQGTSYQEVLAALFLTSVRNVQPRPSVGFKFHAVLVVNSAHLASMAGPDQDRWLPIFWALDYCKGRQLEEERVSGWKLAPVNEELVPSPDRARAAFRQAMDNWDVEAADGAVAGLARSAGGNAVFEEFFKYGARDYRSIGHKAIFVANSFRTLQCIGWQHSEPVVRSLAYALLNHGGESNPSKSDHSADRPWRHNQPLASQIRDDWCGGKLDSGATSEMIAALRSASPAETAELATQLINKGASAQAIWDAVFVGAGELLMRQPGIIGLHGLTTTNALHFAFDTTADEQTRKMLLLQACSFLPMFQQSAKSRGRVAGTTVDDLAPMKVEADDQVGSVNEIVRDISDNRKNAARKVLQFTTDGGGGHQIIDAARRMVFLKGDDAHDYKYTSAVLEDYDHVSPEWRDRFLALSVFNLRGSGERDSGLLDRTRKALG